METRLLKNSGVGVIFSGAGIYVGQRTDNSFCWVRATTLDQVNSEIVQGHHVLAIVERDLMSPLEQRRFEWD